jgi:sigma-54 dependent transcriptional regulator, acetoin dehydrogenase operon transcriptional activator AcoR
MAELTTYVQILDGSVRAMTGYERTRADRSMVARRRYFDQGQAPVGDVPGPVLRSWQRCRVAGHEPNRPTSFELITRGRIRDIEARNRALLKAASSEVHELARVVSSGKMIVLLSDASGAVVEAAGDLDAINPRLKLAARKGVDMSEATIGTNAVGTALVERGPVEIIAREHYFESNTVHTCAAAPLFAPDGRLIGALDVSGDYCPERPNLIDLVVTSARAIENRMFDELRGALLLAFSSREDLLGTSWEAVLALDPGGRVIGANTLARNLLGIQGRQSAERFSDLFAADFDSAVRHLAQGRRGSILQSTAGLRVVAQLRKYARSAPQGVVLERQPAPPSRDTTKRDSTLAFLKIVSEDEGMATAVARARCAYDRGVPILLVGETGTGKELVARGIHYLGGHSAGPFVAVNCASLPESLVEAELFGYVEGAFTGARRGGAQGRLELAHGGTLFLDEIGDMPLSSQGKLLRVIQDRCVVRLGDSRERPVDFMLVCATHQELPRLITERTFREDLYYRINGLRVTLPPLRIRSNILDLAHHLIGQQAACELSESCAELLLSHAWPGNLRQLSNVIISAIALADEGCLIEPKHLPEDFLAQANSAGPRPPGPSSGSPRLPTLDEVEDELIERTIRACHGNRSAAARTLRISRGTLYNKLKRR